MNKNCLLKKYLHSPLGLEKTFAPRQHCADSGGDTGIAVDETTEGQVTAMSQGDGQLDGYMDKVVDRENSHHHVLRYLLRHHCVHFQLVKANVIGSKNAECAQPGAVVAAHTYTHIHTQIYISLKNINPFDFCFNQLYPFYFYQLNVLASCYHIKQVHFKKAERLPGSYTVVCNSIQYTWIIAAQMLLQQKLST